MSKLVHNFVAYIIDFLEFFVMKATRCPAVPRACKCSNNLLQGRSAKSTIV